jgi:Methylase involved in ubiquinone/menaquinone biosynthesis
MDRYYKDNPSTYIVQNRKNTKELQRLKLQDHLLTTAMKGLMPEQPDPTRFQDILDIACGTGEWIMEVAKANPSAVCTGIDISKRMVEYASDRAKQEDGQRVSFLVMDALKPLTFSDKSLDLMNMRLGISFLRTWDWSHVFNEARRLLRPGGVIRVVEGEVVQESNSQALTALCEMARMAFYRSGHLFNQDANGVFEELPALLDRYGFSQIQRTDYTLTYMSGTPELDAFREDMALAFETIVPFIQKWHSLSSEYQQIYRQALVDMRRSDFTASTTLHVIWGVR